MATTNETVQKQIDALNTHNPKTFASYYRPDATVFDPLYPELLRGQDAIEKDMQDFITAFPDVEIEVKRAIEKDDTVAYEISMRGTHTGPLLAPTGHIPATNKKIEIGGGIFARFDDKGRIVEERRYYDAAGLLGQLGLLQ